jgi:hypothetical protein
MNDVVISVVGLSVMMVVTMSAVIATDYPDDPRR